MEGQNQFDSLASVFEIDFGTILGRFGSQNGTENRYMDSSLNVLRFGIDFWRLPN